MAGKKTFDREKMYQKIMPSYLDAARSGVTATSEPEPEEDGLERLAKSSDEAFLNNSEIQKLNASGNEFSLCNITEKIVLAKLEMVLQNMGGCKCERCKMDIVAIALNGLEPQYVVGTDAELSLKVQTSEINQEATSALLKAALKVRKNPRHSAK